MLMGGADGQPELSVHSPMGPRPCDGEAPWPFQPGCWACPAEGWGVGGADSCVWGYVKPQARWSAQRAPAFMTKTNTTSLAHLIGGTSIISSSNPHELTVQGEREAAPAGVHRVQAICWPRGLLPAPHPMGCGLSRAIVRSSLPCLLPHPHHSAPTQNLAARQDAAPQAPTAAPRLPPRKGPQSAALPSGHKCPPVPRSLPDGLPRRGNPQT